MREPVWEFTRANEIAEHIIWIDFDTWATSLSHLFLVTDIQEVALVEAGVRPKSMTTMGSGELHEKSFHYLHAGT